MLPCRACSRFFGAHQHATQMMSMIFYVPCCGHVRSECFQVALTLPYHRTKIYSLKFDLRLWICEWCSTFPLWVAKGQAKLAKLARWVWATRLQRQHLPNQFPAWQLPLVLVPLGLEWHPSCLSINSWDPLVLRSHQVVRRWGCQSVLFAACGHRALHTPDGAKSQGLLRLWKLQLMQLGQLGPSAVALRSLARALVGPLVAPNPKAMGPMRSMGTKAFGAFNDTWSVSRSKSSPHFS